MKNENKPKMLSKLEVKEILSSGKAIYDSIQSEKDNGKVYRYNGNLLYLRDDGKAVLWESQEQINAITESSTLANNVFNMVGWLNQRSDITKLITEAKQTLSSYLNKPIDYSEETLKAVSKIKVKDIVQEKGNFYAILLYACGYYQSKYGGTLSKRQRQDTKDFEPIITDDKGRVFIPYWEYMKNMQEKSKVSLLQSIELERLKYHLLKD